MLRLNFKIAFRSLWRNKGFSLINIGGLAIGLASCLLLLLYVHYELSYDRQFKNSDRNYIVKLNMRNNNQVITGDASPPALTEVALQNIPGIAYISRISLAQSEGKKLYSQQENKSAVQDFIIPPLLVGKFYQAGISHLNSRPIPSPLFC
ncbi:ABC transporter permease [Arcticibacter sp.]|uniref:ABC transporter permease n=1 Tax=Arcticibacter sp. TaxID=1872630 RepID=UPI0038908DD1